jgi:NAD(P)-dependent dehydrogenase (short-subunit alcohol dehydrogenase family)
VSSVLVLFLVRLIVCRGLSVAERNSIGKAYQVNVTSLEAVQKAVNDIVAEFSGRLDIFVANSGVVWEDGPLLDGPADKIKNVLAVNVEGTLNCARAAGQHFRRQKREGTTSDGRKLEGFTYGSFIATASMSGHIVNLPQLQTVYNASKAAVIQMCRCCAESPQVWATRIMLTVEISGAQARASRSSGLASPAQTRYLRATSTPRSRSSHRPR